MYIKEIYVDAFGVLKNQHLRPDRGISCYVLGNGRGKTTLTYFIKAMLFGLEDSKRSLLENERKRYIPWDRDCACGHIVIELDGRCYRIERSFGKRASEDTLYVYDMQTGKPTDALTDCPGRAILGIDADGFERTLFISEKLLAHDSSNDSLSSRLSEKNGTKYDIGQYKSATLAIDTRRKMLQRRGGGEIADCRAKLASLESREAELRSAESEYKSICGELDKTERAISECLNQREKNGPSNSSNAYDKLCAPVDTLKPAQAARKSRGVGIIYALLTVAVIAMLSLALYSFKIGEELYGFVFVFLAAVSLLAFVMIRKRRASGRNRFSVVNTDESRSSEKNYLDELISLERRRSELVFERESQYKLLSEAQSLSDDIASLRQKIVELEDELYVLNLTEELITRAQESIKSKYFSGARESFMGYIRELGEEAELALDTSFAIKRIDGGISREKDAYSKGKRELYSFALRLAIIDSLYESITPPIIIDDAFSSYDDVALAQAMRLLLKLSRKRQIIYLTPSAARAAGLGKRA